MDSASTVMARREQAFRDFCNLEADGVKPNPNALYYKYRDMNREHPELRGQIPTTNRSTIYEWCKEDRWKERYAEMNANNADIKLKKYDKVRENSFGRMVAMQHAALETILDLAINSGDSKVRLAAAETILDRTGLGKIPAKLQAAQVDEKPEAAEAPMLSENATEEEAMEWMMKYGGSSLNA